MNVQTEATTATIMLYAITQLARSIASAESDLLELAKIVLVGLFFS